MRPRQDFCVARFGLILTGVMTIAGCGGSGSSSNSGGVLTSAGFRAAAIAGNQSMAGIRDYPFAAIRDAAPKGSTLFGTRAAASRTKTRLTTPPTFDSGLGLYKAYTVTGNATNVGYFTDAAGTVGAGTASITEPGFAAFTTDYTAYPVTLNIAVNTTAGNLVCNGSGSIVFAAPSGSNTLNGNFTFPRDGVAVKGTVVLDTSGNVSGSLDITENGSILHLTNLAGPLSGILTANVRSDPDGATGTGTFNVQTGAYTLSLKNANGTSTASTDSTGSLVLQYSDGTTQTVKSPLSSKLDGTGGNDITTGGGGGGGTGGGNGTGITGNGNYQEPIALADGLTVAAINATGQLAGQNTATSAWFVMSPPYTTPQYLIAPSGTTLNSVQIDNAGEILGATSSGTWVYYTSPSAVPQNFTGGQYPVVLSAGGAVVSSNPNGLQINYQTSLTAQPTILKGGFEPSAISGNGQMVGRGVSGSVYAGVFVAGPNADPVLLNNPYGVSYYDPEPKFVNNSGLIVGEINSTGSGGFKEVIWSSPTAAPTQVTGIAFATGLNNSGQIVGFETNTGPWLYQNAAFANLNGLLPTGSSWEILRPVSINDSGWIITSARYYDNAAHQYTRSDYVVIKPK